MPGAHTRLYFHIVFSTRSRVPLITPELESELFPFIGGIVRDLGGALVAINGTADHVHLLVRGRANVCVSDLVRHIKSRSTGWVHEKFSALQAYAWQEGYGAFTVSRSAVSDVETYIRRQKDHHRRQDFRTEFMELLRRHDIEFDEEELFR